jgi:hypothetical protein
MLIFVLQDNLFLHPKIQDRICSLHFFWSIRMIFLVYPVIMFLSLLLMFCFIKYNLILVDHVQIFNSMFISLTRVVRPSPYLVFRTWYLLFYVQSIKAIKPGKYSSTSSFVFNILVILYNFCGMDKHFLINPSIFCMSLHTLLF